MDRFKVLPLLKTVGKLLRSSIGGHREHDLTVFHALTGILDESRMERILNYGLFAECLHREERELLYKFVDTLESVEHQYQHPIIDMRARKLATEMSHLLRTVEATFSSDDQEMFRFHSEDPAAYDRDLDELHHVIDKTWKTYKAYRQVVKDQLKV